MNEKRIIGYIERGVSIDHIPEGKVWLVADILGIGERTTTETRGRVSLADGCESRRIGRKGVLKVEGMYLEPHQLNLVALVAGGATVNIISDWEPKRKIELEIPRMLEGIVLCPNGTCISNNPEQKVISRVYYDSGTDVFSCHYCRREFGRDELRFRDY
ncbi:aspartate carbamoyltransferase regulatory subunit [Candidatus Pacearchaeota archaeon]|nr:aspartate carbamoyltransferase regulatory subunit [Candidatus Pacearchaeota archaeon]MBD3283440.1 aspartate carbamoyltransferase regulatory subunit [Candidatus Pacearchaeota archaeon]